MKPRDPAHDICLRYREENPNASLKEISEKFGVPYSKLANWISRSKKPTRFVSAPVTGEQIPVRTNLVVLPPKGEPTPRQETSREVFASWGRRLKKIGERRLKFLEEECVIGSREEAVALATLSRIAIDSQHLLAYEGIDELKPEVSDIQTDDGRQKIIDDIKQTFDALPEPVQAEFLRRVSAK